MSLLANTDAVELESAIPFELYLLRTYRPDFDYVDGEVRERNAGDYASVWCMESGRLFSLSAEVSGRA